MICAEQESGKGTPRPVLIELDPFVVGDEDLETRLLDEVQQPAILDAVPSGLVYVRDLMAGEIPGRAGRLRPGGCVSRLKLVFVGGAEVEQGEDSGGSVGHGRKGFERLGYGLVKGESVVQITIDTVHDRGGGQPRSDEDRFAMYDLRVGVDERAVNP
jgi:hypothetical protein